MMTDMYLVPNERLKALTENLNIVEALETIDIESIQDLNTKIICRTIKTSIDTLREYLQEST